MDAGEVESMLSFNEDVEEFLYNTCHTNLTRHTIEAGQSLIPDP